MSLENSQGLSESIELRREYFAGLVIALNEGRPLGLSQVLDLMNAVDAMHVDLTFEQMRELGNRCEQRVDARQWVISHLRSREERLTKQIELLKDARDLCRARTQDIKDDMLDEMRSKNFKKLVGQNFKASIRRSASVEVELPANGDTFAHFGHLMRVKYEWDKPAVKQALIASPIDLVGVARIVENESVNFTTRGAKEEEGDNELAV